MSGIELTRARQSEIKKEMKGNVRTKRITKDYFSNGFFLVKTTRIEKATPKS